jgi:peptide-methionine (S)-S-oxide reductase
MRTAWVCLTILCVGSCRPQEVSKMPNPTALPPQTQVATLGAGCFWCVEAVFQRLDGVTEVVSGYSGSNVENPTYEQVCDHETGAAEACQIRFDPSKLPFAELLRVFWKVHDPTTVNRQGNDAGPQYRSVIFYHNEEQHATAERLRSELDASGTFPAPIVTAVEPFRNFYPAEEYHQDYYRRNPNQGYCRAVIRPKLEKFEKDFAEKIKPE